jgi:hypothetical protein
MRLSLKDGNMVASKEEHIDAPFTLNPARQRRSLILIIRADNIRC